MPPARLLDSSFSLIVTRATFWRVGNCRPLEETMPESPADSAETRRLLEQVRSGDERAFERLFARHRPYIRRVVALRLDPELRRRVDPSDVIQETQLEAFRRLDDYLKRRPM